jgi:hypothetical protein
MGTADYCGNGNPHTVDGTWIAMFNDVTVTNALKPDKFLLPIVRSSFFPQNFRFEAAWQNPRLDKPFQSEACTPPNATTIKGGAFCLTKARWATIPPDLFSPCPGLVTPEVCENIPESGLEEQQALLFSYSLFLDVGLYRCKKDSAQAWLTSTSDDLNDLTMNGTQRTYEKGEFKCRADDAFEGTVLRSDADGAPLPEGFPGWNGKTPPVKLYLHQLSPGRYKTDISPGPGPENPIGYILPAKACLESPRWCGAQLKLYETASGEFLTTTKPPTAPFTERVGRVLGHLINLKPK